MRAPASRAAAAIIVALLAAVPLPDPGEGAAANDREGPAVPAARVQPLPDPLSVAELLSQDLTVRLHPENRSISVEGSLRLRACSALSKLTLYLYETLDLVSIFQGPDQLSYTRNIERLTIDLATPLAANDTTNLSFYYNGTMWYTENGARQDCVGWEGAYLKGSTFWYLRHHSSDWFDCRLKICCPQNWTAVADGELEAEEHSAGWANYTWVNDAPMLRPALAAGNYSVVSKTVSDINFSVYTYPEHTGLASGYLEEASRIMSSYEGKLGPYGRRSFKVVETAHQTSTGYACSGFVMLYPGAFTKGVVDSALLAHETGHEWFPFSTGYQGWAYPWLWEAFPEYLAGLYGPPGGRLKDDYDAYVRIHGTPGLPSIRNSTWDTPNSYEIVYAKGAWVLRMLDGILHGDGTFLNSLKEYVETYRWGYGSVPGFIAIAAKYSPINLDAFWEQWLNTTKDLDLSFAGARQYDNGTTVRLELEPVNLLEANNPAGMFIEYANGYSERWPLAWDGKAKLLVFEVPSTVKQVALDPEGFLLDVDRSNQAAVPVQSGRMYQFSPGLPVFSGNLTEGVETAIMAVIQNEGHYPAADVGVDFLVDGCLTGQVLIDIPAQGMAQAEVPWRPGPGRHAITVAVDGRDRFHEWDEEDNNLSITVEVAPPPPRIDISCGDLRVVPADPLEGDAVTLSAAVRNTGEAQTPAFTVTMAMDDGAPVPSTVGPLEPGSGTRAGWNWTAARGTHRFLVVADPGGRLNEASTLNNQAALSFFVGWKIGLQAFFTPELPRTFEPVTFTAWGDAGEFSFDFGDGTSTGWASNRSATHEYRRGGNYTVRVEARAAGILSANLTLGVLVQNRAPELGARVNGLDTPTLVDVFFFARPFDLDGEVREMEWDFGDGTRSQRSNTVHQYARPGLYNATFTARDDQGASNRTGFPVIARNRPPECRWTGPGQARSGESLRFEAVASDPDGNITGLKWDFGDWTCSTAAVTSHSYPAAGKYNVTLHVWDDQGAEATYSRTVVVTSDEKSQPEISAWIVLGLPIVIMASAVTLFLWRRRQLERDYEDFFDPPPRRGQNP